MRNFTSVLRKMFLLSSFLFPLVFYANALEFSENDYHIVSSNTTDGKAAFYIDRYDGGNQIEHYLFIQAIVNGQWTNIGYIHHFMDGSNFYKSYSLYPYSISYYNASQTIDTDGDGDTYEYVYKLTINSSPSGVYNSPVMFRLREVDYDGADDVDGFNYVTGTEGSYKEFTPFNLTFYKPTAPQNFSVSQNVCNQINLTWTAPGNIRSDGTNSYDIYQNGVYLTNTASLSYSDVSVADGTTYKYKVRLKTNANYINNYGEFTTEMAGNSKPVPAAPTNFTASDDICNGTVYLQWQWTGETPSNFEVQRSTSQSSGFAAVNSTIAGSQNYFEDTPPARNTTYYYKVRAKNNCNDWGTLSSAISGVAPAIPTAPSGIGHFISNGIIYVVWTDNSVNETGFKLTRTNSATGVETVYELNAGTEAYNDENAELCVPYIYKLIAVGDCGNSTKIESAEIALSPDLGNTFQAGALKASKGYYADIVHLEWDNANRSQIDLFYIYRKQYGSNDSTLIATVGGNLTSFDDKYAENSILYEYSIKAEGLCNETSVFSNVVSSIGFKSPTAIVSGKVIYKDDNPTKGVTITAESDELPEFSSIRLNGSNSYMKIDGLATLQDFTFQAYVLFKNTSDAAIFNRGSQFKLNYSSNALVFSVGGNSLTLAYTPPIDTFVHITTVYDGSSSFIYINGELKASKTGVSVPASSSSSFVMGREGSSGYFNGYIDEIRLWNTNLDSSYIATYFDKYIAGNENGLLGYYRLNENVNIDLFFDVSRTGNGFNENHGVMYNCSYANINPTIEQLWFKAVTDENGNYLITGIPYLSGGSIYKIVPMMAPHEFNPGNKTIYVGDGASVHNNIDFVDISTVTVTAQVFYENTAFPVAGVYVKLDGQIQIDSNEKIIQTNENGTVDFEVPYGSHYISFEKVNHKFNSTYYPGIDPNGNIIRHNFTKPIQIKVFDTTKVKLAGKVVGGPVEAEKDLLSNINPTKNNLGVVQIKLTTQRGYDLDTLGNKSISVSTDPVTGYFELDLLPEIYKPDGVLAIKNNLYTFNSDNDLAIIDMSSRFIKTYETDSIFINKVFSHLDTTVSYNFRKDWIYRSTPEFSVTNKQGGKILSEQKFAFNTGNGIDSIQLAVEHADSVSYPFGKPIFLFANTYDLWISAYEKYVSADNAALVDKVPVSDGILMINNDLALQDKSLELELDEKGEAKYSFLADFPDIANPYTKNLNITFKAGATIVQWPSGNPYEAYILGGKPTGNNFVTTGPSIVDYILRDPPGSASSATLQKGYVTTQTHSFSVTNTTDLSLGIAYQMGVQMTVAAGSPFFMVQNQFDTDNFIKGTIENSYTGGGGYEQSTTLSFGESFSTSDDQLFVGSDGDVFVGHSTNIIYGISKMMEIMPTNEIQSGKEKISENGTYSISIKDGLRVNPEFDTYFIYSQRIIEQENIPHLIKLRNLILEGSNYQKVFTDFDDPKYGSNNDNKQIWGASASTDPINGPSYIYTPVHDSIIDSVRYYNAQISNWYQILAMNEEQKLSAQPDDNHKNISFGAGSVYTSSIGSGYSKTDNSVFEFSVAAEVATSIGFSLNKFGFRLDAAIKNTTNGSSNWANGSEETKEVTYTLSDQDPSNYITVDVLKCQSGNGPVFKTRGGQTSCPYEEEELSQYFEPGVHTLNYATMKIEGAEIKVENPVSSLMPETSPAIFTIKLSNTSQAEKDGWYILGVDITSNPHGAKIKMDGGDISDGVTVFLPYGKTIEKTIEVWKGRPDINEYEDLIVYVGSACDKDYETVSLSAYFAAACSEVAFKYPGNGWIINADDNDTMYVEIGDYNLQHIGFEDFQLQYKPTGTSGWTTVQFFTNDPLKQGEPNTTYINNTPTVKYYWDMRSLADRSYDIRLVSHCSDGSVNYSEILTGILDGQRPQVFGTPQPADGILEIDDDIKIQFNEEIEAGLLTLYNFEVKGTLNNYQIKHESFLRMNGTSDYAVLPDGLSFNDKSFTIEFWMKPADYKNSVVLSKGNDPETSLEIGLAGSDSIYFKLGSTTFTVPFQFTPVVPSTEWQHMAFVFDYENGDVFIYQNDKIILEKRSQRITLNNSGKMYLGKSPVISNRFFDGDIHELRIWSKPWSVGEVYAKQYAALSGNEIGLYGYWPMDEAFGKLAIDKAASRHMEVFAPWVVEPGGNAWNFSGNNFLKFFTGYFALIPEMDYILEFWFKSQTPNDTVCLFSNQKGDGNEGAGLINKAMSIIATPDGKIWVSSKGNLFEASTNNYFNNSWHHFALVVRRSGNVTSYIDGEVQNERENSLAGGLAGGEMYFGVRKWDNVKGAGEDYFYSGKMDEFRIWDMAKTKTQINLDMNSKLKGDELGLMVYIPFEEYNDDGFGNQVLYQSMSNKVTDISATDVIPVVAGAYTSDAPNIKNVRPVEDISFDYVASDDQIIILPKEYLINQLEKNIIEFTVEKIEDKYGNRMASPATWTAYVHRNQVRWEDERRSFTKEIYKSLEFVSTIKNTGGQQVGFTIANLPPWLTAKPASGVINPESTMEITFTVNPALNIGEYNIDILLRTENGFDEKLPVTVKVYKTPPSWNVDPSKYEYSMNIVGKLKIEGVYSTDVFDKIAVFVGDTIRGSINVRYFEEFDTYLAFLNVYGSKDGEKLEFRIWDASVGQILDEVLPIDMKFVTNGVEGTTINPVIFEASGLYRQYIPLAKGWNWVSFNKRSKYQDSLNDFFASLEPLENDQIKTHGGGFNNFDNINKWSIGGIDSIDNKRMYQIKISNPDTIVYSGIDVVPEDHPISLIAGWNHIGYLPNFSMDVNNALRLYTAHNSEIIKSQYAFSMFDERVGWVGTLDVMQPGFGYMIKVNNNAVLTYTNTTIYKSATISDITSPPSGWNSDLSVYEANMSVLAKLDLSNAPELNISNQAVLGAFINDECHGFISPVIQSGLSFDPYFLNISSNSNGQRIEFRLIDQVTGNQYKATEVLQFSKDAVIGTTKEPMILTLKNITTGIGGNENDLMFHCYPNPFNEQLTIEFSGTTENLTIDIVNANGMLVRRIFNDVPQPGLNKLVWEGTLENGSTVAAGMYYVRLVSDGLVQTEKISKNR